MVSIRVSSMTSQVARALVCSHSCISPSQVCRVINGGSGESVLPNESRSRFHRINSYVVLWKNLRWNVLV